MAVWMQEAVAGVSFLIFVISTLVLSVAGEVVLS